MIIQDQRQSQELHNEYYGDSLLNKPFSIVIPAYNEEKRIGKVLDEISTFISINNLPWEVVIAVDGNDRTEEIIDSYRNTYAFIHSNKYLGRSGMGGAIKRGILTSAAEFIILMDGDGSTRLEEIAKKIDLLDDYDIVNFNRYSSSENEIPFKRRFASRGFNFLLKAIFRVTISDTQCGYKLMKRSSIERIIKSITVSNAFFLSALFIYAKKYGVKVKEVSIKYNHSEGSKFNVVMTSISYMISISAFRIRNSRLYVFVPNFIKDIYYRKFRYL